MIKIDILRFNNKFPSKKYITIVLVLMTLYVSACGTAADNKEVDTLNIDATFYIDRNYYSKELLAQGIYHNSEVILTGSFSLPSSIQENSSFSLKPRVFLDSIQNVPLKSAISFNCDFSANTYSFETRLNKYSLKDIGVKLKADSLMASGWYLISGDSTKYPIDINFNWNSEFNIDFVSLASGEIEEELSIEIDRESITNLQLNLNHPNIKDYLHALRKLIGIRNLEIQGTRAHEIPKELYNLKHLDSVNISELYDLDIDYQPNKSVLSAPLVFPMQFLKNPSLRSFRIAGAKVEILEEFPISSKLKSIYFKGYQLDSLPISFLNLKFLEVIDFNNGQIEHSIPENLNQLTQLKIIKICLPNGNVPKGFGPWNNLNQLFIYPAINSISRKAMLVNDSDVNYLVNTLKADITYINGKYF